MLSLWWLFLPIGAALIVIGIVERSDAFTEGGPILIGSGCLLWGGLGAFRAASRRISHS
jgi:hypothetical protein